MNDNRGARTEQLDTPSAGVTVRPEALERLATKEELALLRRQLQYALPQRRRP
jgi:hypothetical protein